MKTYFTVELIKRANELPVWAGWAIAGILTVAVLAVLTAIVVEIIINR